MTIGSWPGWSVTAAREEAKRLRQEIDKGNDPLAARQEARGAPTMADLADMYIERHLDKKRPGSAAADRHSIWAYVLPEFGASKVVDIDHDDIDRLHRKITKAGKPFQANRVVALLSKMFSLSIKWRMRGDNPAKGIERNDEVPRSRYLSEDEIGRLMRTLAARGDRQVSDIVWLLILTGARKGEVFGMRWDQLDLATGVWTKTASATKQKKEHRLTLKDKVIELLSAIKADRHGEPSAYVFPARTGTGHINEIHSWAAIVKAAGLEGVRVHDLRHSYASLLASSGISLQVIGSLLGHSNVATTARYAHLTDQTQRAATNIVSERLTRE